MPNVFARTTKISNAVGRSAYISNKTHKQEEVVLHEVKMNFDWQFYHEYELTHQHNSGQKQNEAREIMFPLPNNLASKLKGQTTSEQKEFIKNLCDEFAERVIGKKHDYEYAVHWNKTRTNLHCHLLFSEREVVDLSNLEQKTYAKDIWQDPVTHKLTKKGTGELVHKKGDPVFKNGQPIYKTDPLSAKDTRFKEKEFMMQRDMIYQEIMSAHGYEFDFTDPLSPYLAQKKLYKGASPDYIDMAKSWNKEVKRYNENVREHIEIEPQMEVTYVLAKRDVLANVREANREEKKITPKAIDMLRSMADYVQNMVLATARRLESDFDHLSDWWWRNRERLLRINTIRHELGDSEELLAGFKQVEEQRQRLLTKELQQAIQHQGRENRIAADMKKYNFSRENAERIYPETPEVKSLLTKIANDIMTLQRKYNWPLVERQRLIAELYYEPQNVIQYLTQAYDRSMYYDVQPVMKAVGILHRNRKLELPQLQKPIVRGRSR